eukprot:scaffold216287_cov15-Tisochrysis_lutea.AAC.1
MVRKPRAVRPAATYCAGPGGQQPCTCCMKGRWMSILDGPARKKGLVQCVQQPLVAQARVGSSPGA